MEVHVINEWGYNEAVLGFSLSYNTQQERTRKILEKYAWGIPGESKFLEMMQVWIDVTAPRYWWQEADTYRVGSTKQSESTMHTIMKADLVAANFEDWIPEDYLAQLNEVIRQYKMSATPEYKKDLFLGIKNMLPEGFLQRRIWNVSYKTLQNIMGQRMNHRLPQWKQFCGIILEQVDHPEFLVKEVVNVMPILQD
jgi:hypothetical protein